MEPALRADEFPMAILAGVFGAVAALLATHIVVSRLRWIEWDSRAAHSRPVLDARPPEPHYPELTELARRVDLHPVEDRHTGARLSPFAQAAGWRPRHAPTNAEHRRMHVV